MMAEEAKAAATKGVDERLSQRDQAVREAEERAAKVKPTPTQRENDLAKVGALDHDAKEPDGSDPDEVAQRRAMEGRLPGAAGAYETRSQPAPQPQRRTAAEEEHRRPKP
jgi:hypothetical protein